MSILVVAETNPLGILQPFMTADDKPTTTTDMIAADTSDEALVALVLTEAEYYGHIIERYEAKLARYIKRLGVRTKEDCEDVLQDVFIKAYRNLNNFDQALSFSSWIYRIAHNESISWYRKRSVRPEGHGVADAETILMFTESTLLDQEAMLQQSYDAQAVQKAVAELPDRYRSVIILRFFEHKEYEEISDIMQIPVGTVGTLIHRAKAKLQSLLAAKEATP